MPRGANPGARRATIGDVARIAGVSRATASRALNDSPAVTPATKERVRAAVQETGFVMNARGRALAMGRSESIAILITEPLDELFADPTYGVVLRGITEGLAASRTMPMLVQAWTEVEHQRALRQFERRVVDAVISISPYVGGDMLEALATGALPVVLCGQLPGAPYSGVFASVYSDDVAGATLAAERMLRRGRRRIAIVNGPIGNPAAVERLNGYARTLDGAFDESLTVSTGWDASSGYDAMSRLLALAPDIDGVLAASDRIAVGALGALQSAGRSVPDDVSIIGFDDHAVAATTTPPLTTIRQPLHRQGMLAAGMALGMVDGDSPSRVVLDMELVERESV